MLWLLASVGAACIATAALAQPAPQLGQTQVWRAWTLVARAPDITAGTTTGRVALGAAGPVARVCNLSATIAAYFRLGSSTITATLAGGDLVMPATCVVVNAAGMTYLAAITPSSTAVLQTTLGTGTP